MNLNYKLKYSIHIAIQKKMFVIQYLWYIYQNTGLHTSLKCMVIFFPILTLSNTVELQYLEYNGYVEVICKSQTLIFFNEFTLSKFFNSSI